MTNREIPENNNFWYLKYVDLWLSKEPVSKFPYLEVRKDKKGFIRHVAYENIIDARVVGPNDPGLRKCGVVYEEGKFSQINFSDITFTHHYTDDTPDRMYFYVYLVSEKMIVKFKENEIIEELVVNFVVQVTISWYRKDIASDDLTFFLEEGTLDENEILPLPEKLNGNFFRSDDEVIR